MSNQRPVGSGLVGWLSDLWKRIFPAAFRWNLEDTFQPEDITERLLPGEEPVLEIRLAWYRDFIGRLVFDYFRWVILVTVILTLLTAVLSVRSQFTIYTAVVPIVLLVALGLYAVKDHIEYNQWRLLKTNYRFIISIPQPGGWPLVDNIELKGTPSVIDTNWSRNPVWRLFQFFTGARDVYISLAAYRFVEGTARVGDALIFPDMMPQDVFELKKVVFMK